MPSADENPLGPDFERALRGELDAVRPPSTSPRYAAARPRALGWRLAPAALAVALVGILGLTAFAATGSANPAVWTRRVITIINTGQSSPNPSPSPTENEGTGAGPTASPEPSESPEPTERPEPSRSPEPRETPEPRESAEPRESPEPSGGDHSGSGETSGGSSGGE